MRHCWIWANTSETPEKKKKNGRGSEVPCVQQEQGPKVLVQAASVLFGVQSPLLCPPRQLITQQTPSSRRSQQLLGSPPVTQIYQYKTIWILSTSWPGDHLEGSRPACAAACRRPLLISHACPRRAPGLCISPHHWGTVTATEACHCPLSLRLEEGGPDAGVSQLTLPLLSESYSREQKPLKGSEQRPSPAGLQMG